MKEHFCLEEYLRNSSFETHLRGLLDSPMDDDLQNHIRTNMVEVLSKLSNERISSQISFGKSVELALKDSNVRRDYALLVLRCLSVKNALPRNKEVSGIEVHISNLIIQALPDINRRFKFSEKRQTNERILIMESVHQGILDDYIERIKLGSTDIQDILSNKEHVLRGLNNKTVKSYLNKYGVMDYSTKIKSIFDRLEEIIADTNDLDSTKLERNLTTTQSIAEHNLEKNKRT